jgi:hypothetical protein
MKTFRMFREGMTMSRKYVAIVYDDDSQQKLRDWCEENGFDLTATYSGIDQPASAFEFHTTVFYSINEVAMKNEVIPLTHGEAFPVKFKLLGDEENVPVLVVSSPGIKGIRDEMANHGLMDKWPDYIPHISLSYARKDYDLTGMELPNFAMKFGYLKIEDINEDV